MLEGWIEVPASSQSGSGCHWVTPSCSKQGNGPTSHTFVASATYGAPVAFTNAASYQYWRWPHDHARRRV